MFVQLLEDAVQIWVILNHLFYRSSKGTGERGGKEGKEQEGAQEGVVREKKLVRGVSRGVSKEERQRGPTGDIEAWYTFAE